MPKHHRRHGPTCRCGACQVKKTDPTPNEIRRQCEQIQAGWNRTERLGRIADDESQRIAAGRMTCPTVRTSDCERGVHLV